MKLLKAVKAFYRGFYSPQALARQVGGVEWEGDPNVPKPLKFLKPFSAFGKLKL